MKNKQPEQRKFKVEGIHWSDRFEKRKDLPANTILTIEGVTDLQLSDKRHMLNLIVDKVGEKFNGNVVWFQKLTLVLQDGTEKLIYNIKS